MWICKISFLSFFEGTPISSSLSNLPGRLKASSILFTRLVAPITITCPREFIPSIAERICATTLRSTSPTTSSLFGAMASISSKKIIDGAFFSASLNTSLILSSASPTNLLIMLGEEIEIKCA